MGCRRTNLGIAPQGTILHPSVYMIFDEYSHVFLNSKELAFRDNIEDMRSRFLPGGGPWQSSGILGSLGSDDDPPFIRILVCGNSGIGKSTLINEVFGTELVSAIHLRRRSTGSMHIVYFDVDLIYCDALKKINILRMHGRPISDGCLST